MFNIISSLCTIVGVLGIVFIAPAIMSVGLVRMSDKDYRISVNEFVLCCIPILNLFYSWKKYNDSILAIHGIGVLLLPIACIIRFFVYNNFEYTSSIQAYTVWFFLICCLLYWLLNVITIWSILSESGIYTFWSKLFLSVTVVFGQISVGYSLPRQLHYYSKKTKQGDLYGRNC